MSGTVIAFEWVDPHTLTRIETADGSRLAFEGMSPDYLGRRGWNRRTLEVGDAVEITYYPNRGGEPGGLLIEATLADGTVRVMIDTD